MSENRLGLALSGGGFRASLFHLGVLRRLAELGLMKHVTHISTVSGGSVVAAHYYLHFKKKYESNEGLVEDPDYIEVVKAVEEEFVRGVDADLRNSLLWNPLSHLEEFTFGNGYGRRMARLYTKHFYRDVTRRLDWRGVAPATRAEYASRGIPLHHAVIRRPDQAGPADSRSSSYPNTKLPERPLVDFNTDETRLANIPSLVMNATCLNTGGPFLFTLNEVGGSECGYVRTDEVFMLLQFKYILDRLGVKPVDVNVLNDAMDKAYDLGKELQEARPELPKTALAHDFQAVRLRDHFYFYQAAKARRKASKPTGDDFWAPDEFRFTSGDQTLRALMARAYWPAVRHLLDTSWGLLRRAKVAAWHLLDDGGWVGVERRAGLTREDYQAEFKNALANIDEALVRDFAQDGQFDAEIQSLVVDFYYFRSAEVLDRGAHHTLHEITLSDAVAASANFPPVFAPFKIFSLFEKSHVTSLSLTDGGVHDNQGVDALLDAGCTHIIISDAGGLVRHEETADDARIPMMDRVIELLMGGLRHVIMRSVRHSCSVSKVLKHAPDVDELRELRRTTHLREAEVIHMTSDPGDVDLENRLEPFAAFEVAALRTDLDVFNELEIAALRHQGYQLADSYAREMREALGITSFVPRAESPVTNLPKAPTAQQLVVLRAGARRFARYSVARPLHAIILSLAVAVVVLALTASSVEHENGHWSSWSMLSDVLNDNVLDWLSDGEDRVSLLKKLETNPVWNTAQAIRKDIIDVARKSSLVTVIFGGWGLILIGTTLVRGARAATPHLEKIALPQLARRNRSRPVFTRTWNIISMTCLALFLLTLNVRWLLGVVHLWSVPLAVTFAVVHVLFTRLWRSIGRLTPQQPPKRPLAPGRAPVTA